MQKRGKEIKKQQEYDSLPILFNQQPFLFVI